MGAAPSSTTASLSLATLQTTGLLRTRGAVLGVSVSAFYDRLCRAAMPVFWRCTARAYAVRVCRTCASVCACISTISVLWLLLVSLFRKKELVSNTMMSHATAY